MNDKKYKPFICQQCGECCQIETILMHGITDEEWIPIIEYVRKEYNGILTIHEWNPHLFEWTARIESIEDIKKAKEDINSELYIALDIGQCPFLRKIDEGLYSCEIHDIRPRICRRYRCDLSEEDWKEYMIQLA